MICELTFEDRPCLYINRVVVEDQVFISLGNITQTKVEQIYKHIKLCKPMVWEIVTCKDLKNNFSIIYQEKHFLRIDDDDDDDDVNNDNDEDYDNDNYNN